MKIFNKDETIECSVEEYKQLKSNDFRLFNNELNDEVKAIVSKPQLRKNGKVRKRAYGHKTSSCLAWTPKEERILAKYDIKHAKKLLPDRTYRALYSRREKLRQRGVKIRNLTVINNPNDKRKPMLHFIQSTCKQIQSEHPELTRNQAMALSWLKYRQQKVK